MNLESIHILGRVGKIMTQTLNHEGLAISYSELRRYQHDIASFTAQHNQHRVVLPYHFYPGQFTSGAIDNWDHESINVSKHDTVSVLFQDKPPLLRDKLKISDSPVTHGPKAFKDVLPCQVQLKFYKPVHHVDIPANYKVADNIYTSLESEISNLKDITWSLECLNVVADQIDIYPQNQLMPSWSASNSVWTNENIPEKSLAFLPVLPHPVTECSQFYSAMKNFVDIVYQLTQNKIPMYCDECLSYCLRNKTYKTRGIQDLVPRLGTFYMVKTVLKCICKYLQGSGADFTWLEAVIFVPAVIENSILNGGNYSYCLDAL